ncbi:MAG TPA: hypothetical protein DEZ08_07265 [Dehalococcoidia bacterium]|jgi:uncharacterized protein (DUF1800 family)|nr:hypothetical protein [Dehalococcoidia bacterium]
MANKDIELMAHLMRRAGFGATRSELETRVQKGYDATVEELLDPESQPPVDRWEIMRYQPYAFRSGTIQNFGSSEWLQAMISSQRPLQEKLALFWYMLMPTGVAKTDHYQNENRRIHEFKEIGMGSFYDILMATAKTPGMLFYLDNIENNAKAVNENWGRELLELFSMGVGNYTEIDVREASRAFTGWTYELMLPRGPINRHDQNFIYRPEMHDDGEKTFLGQTGNFNGEDIIRIILEQPATAQFLARHMYNFFVADDVQVPAWGVTPPRDEAAVDLLADTLFESDYDITKTLRVLFTSDFFKNARFEKIKNPAEIVVSTLRMVGGYEKPFPGLGDMSRQYGYMGMDLLNVPSVEGWHFGAEWINSGSLMRRINFTADMVGDASKPGIQDMINRIKESKKLTPVQLVDQCLDLMGPLDVTETSKQELVMYASEGGNLNFETDTDYEVRITELLQLIVSLREYQYA